MITQKKFLFFAIISFIYLISLMLNTPINTPRWLVSMSSQCKLPSQTCRLKLLTNADQLGWTNSLNELGAHIQKQVKYTKNHSQKKIISSWYDVNIKRNWSLSFLRSSSSLLRSDPFHSVHKQFVCEICVKWI